MSIYNKFYDVEFLSVLYEIYDMECYPAEISLHSCLYGQKRLKMKIVMQMQNVKVF